jgi:hypothetical protein
MAESTNRRNSDAIGADETTPAEMTVAEYCRYRGCARNTVQEALNQGRIKKNARGRIDVAIADRDWNRLKGAAGMGSDTSEGAQDLRTRRMTADAELAEFKVAEAHGSVIPLDDVTAAWFAAGRALRLRIEAIPARAAALCVGQSRVEIRRILAGEIQSALEALPDVAPGLPDAK